MPRATQAAEPLDLEWTEADPISIALRVVGHDWSGDYAAQVRDSVTGELVLDLTVTAVLDGTDTLITLVAEDSSAALPDDSLVWDMQQIGGVTRLAGVVTVHEQVTRSGS